MDDNTQQRKNNGEKTSLLSQPPKYGTASSDEERGETCIDKLNVEAQSNSTKKSIGLLGSFAIAVNSLAGPAILQLPATYQLAGLIPTTVCLIAVGVLSAFCSLHMANVVSQVPNNGSFHHKVEFSEPFRIFWGRKAFIVTQIMFFLCTVSLNVAAIVDTAQVVDTFLGHSISSWGLTPHGIVHWEHGPCSRREVKLRHCDPFDKDGNYILTAGYVVAAAVFLPVSLLDLKENAGWQIFGFLVLLVTSLEFLISFALFGFKWSHVPLWGGSWDRMLGVILFNFSLVVAIPAWLHEKKESVSVATGTFTPPRNVQSKFPIQTQTNHSLSCLWILHTLYHSLHFCRYLWSVRDSSSKPECTGTNGVRRLW